MENYAPQKDKYHDDWDFDLTKDDKFTSRRIYQDFKDE